MPDKNPDLSLAIRKADLEGPLPDIDPDAIQDIGVGKNVIHVLDYNVFYLFTTPSENQLVKGDILLLHDQTNTSLIWSEIETLQTFAAFGYRCWAPDLPSAGRTGGAPIEDDARMTFIKELVDALGIKELTIVGCSMAGRYVVPLLCQKRPRDYELTSVVAIALSDTNKIFQSSKSSYDILTPCLVLRGARDTSLGLSAADTLSQLPNAKVVVVPDGRHLCHQSHPDFFHRVVLNFLGVVARSAVKKSICVTEL